MVTDFFSATLNVRKKSKIFTVPPRTTKRRTTTNLKTKSNQNRQKIKLYGSLTTKELNKKQSSRPGGQEGQRLAGKQRGLAARWQLVDWVRRWTVDQEVPHSCAHKPGGTTRAGGETDHTTQGSSEGK